MTKQYTNKLNRQNPIYKAWVRQLEIQGHYHLIELLKDDYFSPVLSRSYRNFHRYQRTITSLILSP